MKKNNGFFHGSARWCGRYEGKPAIILDASLWVYRDDDWFCEMTEEHFLALSKKLGMPWKYEEIEDLPIVESIIPIMK